MTADRTPIRAHEHRPEAGLESVAVVTRATDQSREIGRTVNTGQFARFSGLLLLGLFILAYSLWEPSLFLSLANFRNIAGSQGVTIVLAIGLLFTLAAGQYDLSAAQNLGFSAVVSAWLMVYWHVGWLEAVLVTVCLGLGIGLANGVIVTRFGVNSFIATLGMQSVLLALTELISGDQFIGPVSHAFQKATSYQPAGVPVVFWYAIGLCAVAWYVLEHTPVGRRMYATGANPETAKLAGIRTARLAVVTFVVCGGFAALAGVMATSQFGEVSPTIGPSYLLPAFAACFLGMTQLKLGRANVWGTVVAIYLLDTGVVGLELAGGAQWVTDLFNGVALIVAVGCAVALQKRRRARGNQAKRGGGEADRSFRARAVGGVGRKMG
jgi:ribose transport system permease protein